MAITVGGTAITFNDSSTQGTAYRFGSTDRTYTSAASNFTLTPSATIVQRLLLGGSNPTNPTLTLPDMSTMQEGNIFTVCNTSSYSVGLSDSTSVIREFVPTGFQDVNLFDNSTAVGVWATSTSPTVTSYPPIETQTITGYKVNAGYTVRAGTMIRISATECVYCWSEYSGNIVIVYAQLYTFNTTTLQLTAGNRVTLQSVTTSNGATGSVTFNYDCDNAGHALLFWGIGSGTTTASLTGYGSYAGLSVSGGVLYVSTVTTLSLVNIASCCSTYTNSGGYATHVGYLGSNNAYAINFVMTNGNTVPIQTMYIRGVTVTGTTTVTVTQSASNTSYSIGGNAIQRGRTGLTTFSLFSVTAANSRAITYTPASNTFTAVARTSTITAMESAASIAEYSSFAQGGFIYNSAAGLVVFGTGMYTITNAGAAGVTATSSSTIYTTKPVFTTGYTTVIIGTTFSTATRKTLYSSSGTQVAIDTTKYYTFNTGSSTFNVNTATCTSACTLLFSSSFALKVDPVTGNESFTTRVIPIATPFVL